MGTGGGGRFRIERTIFSVQISLSSIEDVLHLRLRLPFQQCKFTCEYDEMCFTFKKYKTFSVLIYSYINTSGIGKTKNCVEKRQLNFEFFQFPRVLM